MKQSPLKITNEQVSHELNIWFKNEDCEALARETGFIQRSTSRLTGSSFFNLLTIDVLDEARVSYEGLCDILEDHHPDLQITPQALCERMNSAGAVKFLKAGMEKTLKETTQQPLATIETTWLAPFPRVLLQDSTQIQLNEELADHFKGSSGNASAAAIKVDYSYDVKSEKAEHLAIRQGADSDQGFAEDLAARAQKGDLVIRDLGYFCLNFFAYLASIGAFFLSRLSFNVNVYLTADAETPINLIQHINRSGGGKTIEFNVFLGQKHRIPIRLIAYRLPPAIYRKRQKAAIKSAKRKGRSASLSYLKFLKYSFFITNVPAALWPMEAVGTIYRLRWQVELVFKNWKSLFQINVLKGTRPERILCLIYGRLIVILVVQRLLALASALATGKERELSTYKAIQWFLRKGRLLRAFIDRQFDKLIRQMASCLKKLLKQKRKRPTTWQLIARQVAYLDSFMDSDYLIHQDLQDVGA
ncbi:conserved hypothetical protein [Crenothrix polyspora]|uniref:Transposase IS4-like domain-containing protein n=1 Tax=Crenothrix polyspora TaxID=360316 RepID=A0A1R4HFB1_9GAMM|nr:IS4 family transposase [Crenothrix polyspora]SJM94896.1 conserved hypothetical protein [Crenothrix polyspora]